MYHIRDIRHPYESYMFIDAIEYQSKIRCWYRTDDNELHLIEEPAPYYCYRRDDNNGAYKSLFGESLTKQVFDNRQEYNTYVNTRSGLYESDISPVYKFLSDTFYEHSDDNYVNVGMFDIEVDYDLRDNNGYPLPENPFGKINSVSLYDVRKDEFHMVVLHDCIDIASKEGENLTIHHCVTERQVLDTFFKLIADIDILCAHYGDHYDIPYIYERCKIIYGDKEGLRKMCRGGHTVKSYEKKDDYGNTYTHYSLVGRVHLDYLELYKRFTFGKLPSNSLDYISNYELGAEKLKYKGDLGDLYRNDPKTFFEYSLHDSRLLRDLDRKLKFVELAAKVTAKATTKFSDVFGTLKVLEHTIINFAHFDQDEMIIIPDKGKHEKIKYEGGYVADTKVGVYGYVSTIDLEGLYPAVMRTANISPETHLFQCSNNNADFVKVVEQSTDDIDMLYIPTGEVISMKGFELYSFLREQHYTISAHGSIFSDEEGLIPKILTLWYDERKAMKKKSKEYFKAGDTDQGQYYDMLQLVRKLYNNSIYGAMGNIYCRFYSLDLVESITANGREIEKFQLCESDKIIENAA